MIDEAWIHLLEQGEIDDRLVETASEEAHRAEVTPIPTSVAPGLASALRRGGISELYSHQAAGAGGGPPGRRDRHQRHRLGKVALVQPSGARRPGARRARPRALPLPDEGPRPGPGEKAPRAGARRSAPCHLRRRHAARRPARDPAQVEPRPHEPGHAQHEHAPAPQALERVPRRAAVGGGRRGPHLPGGVRLARGECACAACSGWPGSTAPSPASCARRRRSPTRSSWPRAWWAGRSSSSTAMGAPRAGRRIAIWNPPVIDPATMKRRSVLSEAAELLADLVIGGQRTICFLRSRRGIELIQRFTRMRLEDLGHADLAGRIAPYRAGYTPQQRREIEASLAPRSPACGRRHRRAGAGHRHRRAGRGHLRDVSGDRGQPAADVGAGGAPARGHRALHRRRRRARPVLLPPPDGVPRPARRGGDLRPHQRAHPARPHPRRCVRGAPGRHGRPARRSG